MKIEEEGEGRVNKQAGKMSTCFVLFWTCRKYLKFDLGSWVVYSGCTCDRHDLCRFESESAFVFTLFDVYILKHETLVSTDV